MSDQETSAAAPREMTDDEFWELMRGEFGLTRSMELCAWMVWMYLKGYKPAQTHALRLLLQERGMQRRTAYRAVSDLCRLREMAAAAEGRELTLEELPAFVVTHMAHPAKTALQ